MKVSYVVCSNEGWVKRLHKIVSAKDLTCLRKVVEVREGHGVAETRSKPSQSVLILAKQLAVWGQLSLLRHLIWPSRLSAPSSWFYMIPLQTALPWLIWIFSCHCGWQGAKGQQQLILNSAGNPAFPQTKKWDCHLLKWTPNKMPCRWMNIKGAACKSPDYISNKWNFHARLSL